MHQIECIGKRIALQYIAFLLMRGSAFYFINNFTEYIIGRFNIRNI